MNRESSIDIHTLPLVKETTSGELLYGTGSSAWCSGVLSAWVGCGVGGRLRREGKCICI